MIAAIYARKSTDQFGVSDEARSVTRQVEHARAFAVGRGWTVDEAQIYVDDGISGAEFAERPGFVRLMNALKPRPQFQVLVMSEESRLGREMAETVYALWQIVTAGVRVFSYLEGRERTLDSPIEKAMLSITACADELEREKARHRTHDAMVRKARAGHVTGGRVFGYDNHEITESDGQGRLRRVRVERRINESEAAVVRRIFECYAAGDGLPTIAKTLNAEHLPCPRPQQGRPSGWAPSSVREILRRPLYRGQVVWNKTRKRDQRGQSRRSARDATDRVEVDRPELRLVSDALWTLVEERRTATAARYLCQTRGARGGRPPGGGAKHLLAGLLRCADCGSSLEARSRSHGRRRVVFYGCSGFHRRGAAVCRNRLTVPQDALELAVLDAVKSALLHPEVLDAALARAERLLLDDHTATEGGRVEAELAEVEQQIEHLSEAIASGGQLPSLLSALSTRELRRTALRDQLSRSHALRSRSTLQSLPMRAAMQARLEDWRGLLRRQTASGREILKRLIVGRLECEARPEGFYVFRGVGTWTSLLSGVVPLPFLRTG